MPSAGPAPSYAKAWTKPSFHRLRFGPHLYGLRSATVSRFGRVFIGDNPTVDILGAHGAGVQTAWFGQGAFWPKGIPPMPGVFIDELPSLLELPGVGQAK